MSIVGAKSLAHDIAALNADGINILYNWNDKHTELTVTYFGTRSSEIDDEYCGNIVIPESVMYEGQTYPVTSIGTEAFKKCSCLTSVTIPNSVKIIEDYAFESCKGLISVTMGNGITSIGSQVFNGCTSLTSVHISDLKAWCKILFKTISDSTNPLYYAHHLYLDEEEIKDLVIPNSLNYIGDKVFSFCSGLTSVTIPNSVISIGIQAFRGCSGLTSLTVPEKVTSIGAGAFYECSGLTTITSLNKTPPAVGVSPFYGCYSATLQVPKGSKKAYMNADYWNKFKKIVEIDPAGIQNIILDKEINSPVYDFNGRKLKNPQKGINIINGKKVIIK